MYLWCIKMTGFKPSKYQEAIYQFIQKDKGNAIVEAVAGSGKTTTIVEATKLIPKEKKAIFVAFNRSIALELQRKLPKHVKAQTLHSFGFSLFFNNSNCQVTPEVDGDKLYNITERVLKLAFNDREYRKYISGYMNIISKIKAELLTPSNESLDYIIDRYNITVDFPIRLSLINTILNECKKDLSTVDYDDMIWIPIVCKFSSRTYDWVFVDEVQDLNRSQFELIKKMCNGHSRIVAVGDSRQSIYAFRGADTNSMKNFKEYFNAKELPLSICYRCPSSVIKLAQQFVPQIETFDKAPVGKVDHITEEDLDNIAKPGDLIICRTNAPLVKIAFMFIRQHRKAVIRGRDIGKRLLKIVKELETNDMDLFINELNRRIDQLRLKLQKIEDGVLPRKNKSSYTKEMDQLQTIIAISEKCSSITSLKQTIQDIFSDKQEGIVLSSVHKVKGLEAKRIFILYYDELMPHPMAETPEEFQQEINIKYVAVTRAREELYLVAQPAEGC